MCAIHTVGNFSAQRTLKCARGIIDCVMAQCENVFIYADDFRFESIIGI